MSSQPFGNSSGPNDQSGGNATESTLLGQPVGLFLLFMVEMWERFSYYGMRAILGLYLKAPLESMIQGKPNTNPGRGWAEGEASNLSGWYTGLSYLLPILGGLIADKLIGTHRSMIVGGLLIALGHVVLAITGFGDLGHSQLGMSIFIGGLALIIIGTGHFKPSVSVMVGQLYKPGDPRRDVGFSIFYMGINLGAFICPFICGTLGEKVGWHWGFGSAAVGMLLGLSFYMLLKERYLPGIGAPPDGKGAKAPLFIVNGIVISTLVAAAFHMGVLGRVDEIFTNPYVLIPLACISVLWMAFFTIKQAPNDRGPVASIFLFMLLNVLFWAGFEQASTSINFFTDSFTDRNVGSFEVPTSWLQAVNPLGILLLAPVFGGLWVWLARRNANPSQPAKIGLGLIGLGLGFSFMVLAGLQAKVDGAKATVLLIAATYVIHTLGELCLSPTGLAYVTKAAPKHAVSLLMGVWFLSSFVGNFAAGKLAAIAPKFNDPAAELGVLRMFKLGGQADFFVWFTIAPIVLGVVVLVLTPMLKKLLRNATD